MKKLHDRKFKVTMKFHLSGEVPLEFTEELIKLELKDAISEIETNSEILHGERDDYIFTLFAEKVETQLEEYNYEFVKDMFCEHCGELKNYFDVKIHDGVDWCYDCGNHYLSPLERENIRVERKTFKKKFLKERIKDLKKELKELE